MRISDWSSDVCSSDLRGRGEELNRQNPRCCPPSRRYRPRRRTAPSPRGPAALPSASDRCRQATGGGRHRRSAWHKKEIGRASCRERGCQYVAVRVGAVALKIEIIGKDKV